MALSVCSLMNSATAASGKRAVDELWLAMQTILLKKANNHTNRALITTSLRESAAWMTRMMMTSVRERERQREREMQGGRQGEMRMM